MCIPCPSGYKSYAGPGSCTAWSACAANQFQTPPTISTDRLCTNYTACAATQFEAQAPTTYSSEPSRIRRHSTDPCADRVCQNCTNCTALNGQFQTSPVCVRMARGWS